MTMPDERTRSVQYTRKFLRALLHKRLWKEEYPGLPWPFPRVRPPKRIYQMAGSLLRHYPGDFYLKCAAKADQTYWGMPVDHEASDGK